VSRKLSARSMARRTSGPSRYARSDVVQTAVLAMVKWPKWVVSGLVDSVGLTHDPSSRCTLRR
jgi:hypothetical protein